MKWASFLHVLPDILISLALLLILVASQLFWVRKVAGLGRRLIRSAVWRRRVAWVALAYFALLWFYNLVPIWWRRGPSLTRTTASTILLDGPFSAWLFGSVIGFVIIVILSLPYRLAAALFAGLKRAWRAAVPGRRPATVEPSRRRFLEQAAVAAGTVPFLGGFYGVVFGRLNLQTNRQRIALPRLPRAFEGFRIAQLSDIHIGTFMTSAEIRHCVEVANQLKPDLIVLTGDYVTWDPTTEGAAVEALSGLRAPYGVFGSLGNHEMWTKTEASITRLFAAWGIPILRQQNTVLRAGGEELNLIGVDFQTRTHMGFHEEGMVHKYLNGVEPLLRRDAVNILLSHNPNTFDRAAELGIDLSLAGHTHGGQVAFEFVNPNIAPSRLITPYVAGWFGKPGGQLYVNRGIGTIGVPIRLDVPPEITLFELVREA
jgi:uncharacterized protein